MKKYQLLDLFCGGGGAGKGYVDAGFEVDCGKQIVDLAGHGGNRILDVPLVVAFGKKNLFSVHIRNENFGDAGSVLNSKNVRFGHAVFTVKDSRFEKY